MATIPIKNIYYLLSYAWDLLEEAEILAVETENLPHVLDLLTRLLVSGTQHLLKRGINCGYIPQTDVLSTIRGRVDFGISSRRLLLKQAKAQCEYEEFRPDLLHNQILKATLRTIGTCSNLSIRQKAEVHAVLRRMEGINTIYVRKSHFKQVRLHKNNAHYQLLMNLCELLYDNLLPNEQTGDMLFRDFFQDKPQMALLFEAFVANFYKKETDLHVTRQERIQWDSQTSSSLLPEMHADAVIRDQARVVVVECKFYEEPFQYGYRSDKPKLHSSHLYQLSTYIQHLGSSLPNMEVEGLLIYPTVDLDHHFKEDLYLSGKRILACTVDLKKDWVDIRDQFLKVLGI